MFGMITGVSADLTTNNEAYWTLDNTLLDVTGNSHTLTNSGATYTTSGKINGSYDFFWNKPKFRNNGSKLVFHRVGGLQCYMDGDSIDNYIFCMGEVKQ